MQEPMHPIEASGRYVAGDDWKVPIPQYCKTLVEAQASYEALPAQDKKDEISEYYEEAVEQARLCELQFRLQHEVQEGFLMKSASVPIDVMPDDGESDHSSLNKEEAPKSEQMQRQSPTSAFSGSLIVADVDPKVVVFGARASFALNVFLLCIKSLAAYRTGSTTVFASLLDSILDLMSGAIMLFVSHVLEHSKAEKYPTGKHHFEPIGTLVFACAMFVAATKLIQNCVDEIININNVSFAMDFMSLAILMFVIGSKAVAAVWCFRNGAGSSTLTALAEDHRNDIVANIVAVIGFVFASKVSVWADPILGLCVTFFILRVWGGTIFEQVHALSGHVADKEVVNQIIALVRNHHASVLAVDTVRVVTSGTGYVVEADIVLPASMRLDEAHNIGESLQVFLERVPGLNVNRAYVHLDTESDHDPKLHL